LNAARTTTACVYAEVLTLEPKGLNEFAPLFLRSCAKFVKNDCNAAVD